MSARKRGFHDPDIVAPFTASMRNPPSASPALPDIAGGSIVNVSAQPRPLPDIKLRHRLEMLRRTIRMFLG